MNHALILLPLFIVLAYANDSPLITKAYTDYLHKHANWEAMSYEENPFKGWTEDEVKGLLGLLIPSEAETMTSREPENLQDDDMTFPESLDWRQIKAECTHKIGNQGGCGSCWAFAVAGVVSDRCCISGTDHGWLSVQELVSCDTKCSGCRGGYCNRALNYVKENGLVPETCYPYIAKDPPCPNKCNDGKSWKSSHVCFCTNVRDVSGMNHMKSALGSGPIAVGVQIFKDFMYYKTGVYHRKSNDFLGNHAMRCTGYGTDPEMHWIVANSFGSGWGDNGYIRIGSKEIGVEDNCYTCDIKK